MRAFVLLVASSMLFACSRSPPPQVPSFAPGREAVRLLFVGDLSTARGVEQSMRRSGNDEVGWLLEPVASFLKQHDLVVANLECVLADTDDGEATAKSFRIRASTSTAQALRQGGINVVNVANNHAMDFGERGLLSTLKAAADQGLAVVGAASTSSSPMQVFQVGTFRVGVLAYNQHGDEYKHDAFAVQAAPYSAAQMVADVRAGRSAVDVLIVTVHGGPELSFEPAPWQTNDAHAAIDAGADAWVGHHPHVVQPVERYKSGFIAYSLGDFVFDKTTPWLVPRNRPRLLLELDVRREGTRVVVEPTVVPATISREFRPLLRSDNDAERDALALDLSSLQWRAPAPRALSSSLSSAVVTRRRAGGDVACSTWLTDAPVAPRGKFRWLAPRWRCGTIDDDKARPFTTVANTTELLNHQLKRGIWAAPDAQGPVRLQFSTTFDSHLRGFASLTDWSVQQRAADAPIHMTVKATAGEHVVEAAVDVPVVRGGVLLDIDTQALAGRSGTVVVELSAERVAKDGDDSGVVFDLEPAAQ